MVFKKGDPNIYRRKKKDAPQPVTETVSSSEVSMLAAEPVQSTSRYDLVLGICRIRHGNFSGLWELSELQVENDHTRTVRILTDANTKSLVVTIATKRLAKCL